MSKAKKLPSQEELRQMFDYDFEEGILVWRERADSSERWNSRYAGTKAGSLKKRYVQVEINNSSFQAHRIIWKLAYGEIPVELQIDHIDGDKLNNRLDNLRLVTNQQNQFNRSADKGRKYKGVYRKGNKFKAEIRKDGKMTYLGLFDTEVLAALAYDRKAKEIHGQHFRPNIANVEAMR